IRIGFSEFSEVSTCSQLLTHFSNLGFIIILYKNVRRFPLSLRLECCYILFKLLTSLFLTYLNTGHEYIYIEINVINGNLLRVRKGLGVCLIVSFNFRSEERRVGKGWICVW